MGTGYESPRKTGNRFSLCAMPVPCWGDALMESVCSNMEIRKTGIPLSPLPSSRLSAKLSVPHARARLPPPSSIVSCPLILCLFLICGTDILYRHPIGSCVACHVINQKERKEKTSLSSLGSVLGLIPYGDSLPGHSSSLLSHTPRPYLESLNCMRMYLYVSFTVRVVQTILQL